jgi:hypothetical protein
VNLKPMLLEGLSDATGFVGGALLGFWAARLFGWNILDAGYSNSSIAGIVLVGLGGGLGLHTARSWRRLRERRKAEVDTGSKHVR